MGNNISKVAPCGEEFQYSLDPGEDVKTLDAVDTQFASHPFHLEVWNWASEERSYRLRIENRFQDEGFSDNLNWVDNALHLVFWMPAGYEGGPVELLRRVKRLFEGSQPLGIIDHAFGGEAIDSLRSIQPTSTGKERSWTRTVKRVSGCSCRRLKIYQSGLMLFKITAENNTPVGFLVDPTNPEYCQLVGERSPVSSPRKRKRLVWLDGLADNSQSLFFDVMALPARLWQRIHAWNSQFHEARRVNDEGLFDTVVHAARQAVCEAAEGAGFTDPIIVRMEENGNWWNNIFDNVFQRMREEHYGQIILRPRFAMVDDGRLCVRQIEAHGDSIDVTTRELKANAGQTGEHQDLHSMDMAGGCEETYASASTDDSRVRPEDIPSKECEIQNPQEQRTRKGRMRAKRRHLKKMAEGQKRRETSSPSTDNGSSDVTPDYVVDDVAIPSIDTAALIPGASPESVSSSTSFKTAPETRQPTPPALLQGLTLSAPSAVSLVHTTWLQTLSEGVKEKMDEAGKQKLNAQCPHRLLCFDCCLRDTDHSS